MTLDIEPLTTRDDIEWCAQTMATNQPWQTLGRDYDACVGVLSNIAKERYIIRVAGERAGLLILDMTGPFPGYIQTICVAGGARNRGVGSAALAWAEERIFRESPNVFMCVSSFNQEAQRLYRRLGFEHVGTLKSFIVDEHDEWLLRKTRGPWSAFRDGRMQP
jgi:[ribosomal protein S18]-alanine N-acetyltransferase